MSRENVEVVRAMLDAWNARSMDAFRDLHDPDVVINRFIEGWPEPGPVTGRAEVMSFYEGMRPWEADTAEPISEFIDADPAVAVRLLWRTSIQSQEVSMELTAVYTLRQGKVCVIEFFRDHDEALQAARSRK